MKGNGWVPRTKEQVESQHIVDVAGLVEQQNSGRNRWITTRVVLTDANCADPDVASHAQWLIDNPPPEVRITDKRRGAVAVEMPEEMPVSRARV